MESLPVFVGLDYHRQSIQLCVVDRAGRVLLNRRCGNSVLEVAGAVRAEWTVQRAAIESCCGAADFSEAIGTEAGWPITLAHPGYVARMKCNPDKTDYADARMLAELCRAGLVPPVWLPPRTIRELRLLIRLRGDLVGQLRAVKTRILAVLRQQRIDEPVEARGRWTKRWLSWLASAGCALTEQGRFAVEMYVQELGGIQDRVRLVEARLRQATSTDSVVARLLTIKGVGEVTAWTMRALIGQFDRFTSGKQLARFCAVTPRNASSGERVAAVGMVRAGDGQLKNAVIEAAQRLRRYDPRWREFSASMAARGKATSVIIGAIANRWMRWLFHQIKETPMAA